MTERKLQRLVILEGPDCAGKTTLMNDLRKELSGTVRTVHHGPYSGITADQLPRFYVESMFPLFEGEQMLMDRCWLSEPIYGLAYRGGQNRVGHVARRQLERMALRHGAVVALCLPPWETVKASWLARKGANEEAEYLDKIEQLEVVYNAYAQLEESTDLPVVRYDYTRHRSQVRMLASKLIWASDGVHREWHIKSAGSASPKVILVGEKPSEPTNRDTAWQFPFCSFGSGSSGWVTQHLMNAGIRERELFWVNADSGLYSLKEMWSVPIIALGQEAAKRVASDVGREPDAVVSHPQYHKRFKAGEDYELAATIRRLTK